MRRSLSLIFDANRFLTIRSHAQSGANRVGKCESEHNRRMRGPPSPIFSADRSLTI